ncbi:alpha/beta fold hydrolase [Microbacterium soli]|uniref:Alpha/beta fold hydrolase n=2 Tax=Microbacterium soli TaxID=446075 RepID=A0ABP7MVT5_9MICO
MPTRELLAIDVVASGRLDVNSGVARMSGKTWAVLWRGGPRRASTVVLFVHPASNFMGHYATEYMSTLGVDAAGLATRYVGNDSALIMENCLLDIGAAIAHLRDLGYERVVLVGNSGGGGLAALYQAQAESPDITRTPAGDPVDIAGAGLSPADSLVMAMAHPGRAVVYTEALDAAIVDELNPFARDESLDMFDPRNGPVYPDEFIRRYREAQIARNRRITEWAQQTLIEIAEEAEPSGGSEADALDDLPFVVHGTAADPRFLDGTIDPSDRKLTTLWGAPWSANFRPASLGHYSSLRSWLSQWSYDLSRANAYKQLPKVQAPVLVVYGSADCAAFPSHARGMADAVRHDDVELVEIEGADHYFQGRPDLARRMSSIIVDWGTR